MEEIFREIKNSLTTEKLQELTVMLLEAKKGRRREELKALYVQAFGGQDQEDPPARQGQGKTDRRDTPELSENRMFIRLIHFLHPDRLAALEREIAAAAESGNLEKLKFYRTLFSLKKADTGGPRSPGWAARDPARYEWVHTEEFVYGYDPSSFQEEFADEDEDWDDPEEMDFFRAVKMSLLGALDFNLGIADLTSLTGELDLGGMELRELDGLEYCAGLTGLNLSENLVSNIYNIRELTHLRELYLSENQISDIEPLQGLTQLEILDISYNDIEDMAPLLALDELKFVNLLGNPIQNPELLLQLKKRGVEILY